jgi:hypothetical protein
MSARDLAAIGRGKASNHPTPTLASQNSSSLKSNRMRQTLP